MVHQRTSVLFWSPAAAHGVHLTTSQVGLRHLGQVLAETQCPSEAAACLLSPDFEADGAWLSEVVQTALQLGPNLDSEPLSHGVVSGAVGGLAVFLTGPSVAIKVEQGQVLEYWNCLA